MEMTVIRQRPRVATFRRGYIWGYRFAVLAAYLSNFAVQKVGALEHTEYWIPAEELATFNENIVGLIEVIQEFGGAPNAQ
jgi:hypothetical protein